MKTHLLIVALLTSGALAGDLPLPGRGNVTLPLDEYNKLLELAAQPVKTPDAPPVPYVLKVAQITLDVTGESVTGTILIEGEVLAPGETKVPLVSGMVITDAQRDGAELPVERENGVLTALLPGPGEFAVKLKTAMPLAIETGRASLKLLSPSAGAVRLTLCVPGEQTAVNLGSGLTHRQGLARRPYRDRGRAHPRSGCDCVVGVAAQRPLPPAQPKPARFLADVKSLISINDSEVAIAALAEITVVQGEPSQFVIVPPDGYELISATGPTLIATDVLPKAVTLHVSDAAARQHQFLIAFARANSSAKAEVPLVTIQAAQRETGEVLIESEGAMEMNAAERGGLRRMDLKETSPYLRSMAHASLHAAFRYQKRPTDMPALALDWTRFPDSDVLSAVAQQAVVTTLVTSEGRSLTKSNSR